MQISTTTCTVQGVDLSGDIGEKVFSTNNYNGISEFNILDNQFFTTVQQVIDSGSFVCVTSVSGTASSTASLSDVAFIGLVQTTILFVFLVAMVYNYMSKRHQSYI